MRARAQAIERYEHVLIQLQKKLGIRLLTMMKRSSVRDFRLDQDEVCGLCAACRGVAHESSFDWRWRAARGKETKIPKNW